MAVMFGVPLLLILFREPLTRLIRHQSGKMEESKAMFLVEGFFEMFETLLSYFSNTISFIRIGAFAVSHAAIMEVVLQLTGAESGNPNWLGVIFGNLFVCGFEGLIVGIQVLRLEYYEMFSRFYKAAATHLLHIQKRKPIKNRRSYIMTLATKIVFIAALLLSIVLPFCYFYLGEKNVKNVTNARWASIPYFSLAPC